MGTVLFNLNDIVLLMTIVFAVVFSTMLILGQAMNRMSVILLSGFMLSHALISVHELTYYAIQFRYEVLDLSPNLFFIGNFAYCLDAPFIYLYVKSITQKEFSLNRADALHLIPLGLFLVYMVVNYYGLEHAQKVDIIKSWTLTTSWHYVITETIIKVIRILYLAGCLKLINEYYEAHKGSRSELVSVEINWLKLLAKGFLLVLLFEALLSLTKVYNVFSHVDIDVLINLGVSVYYLTFAFIVALLIYSVNKYPSINPVPAKAEQTAKQTESKTAKVAFKHDFVTHIEQVMEKDKPYLMPDLSIDTLAEILGVSAKDLSVTLNRHYQMNFYEFVNQYRIEEAKRLLSEDDNLSVTDLLYQVGFNSKSVFYTFFKKIEKMTPSQYKKQIRESKA
ncbi:AraC family transcriptional regulator [Pseudomaricurvus alcaniphilus]|uniref:helix-turn-helix domain-containing protein n=1 Tax=Pseudomaricurvus alcaniphilus TaxID=1166482 RepID=UPI0014079186|nr:helix-turn-helix domain-containing protein [Pseudomaricurvus alcaniphilus]NHN37184.1 AraC family transcriptional regulator [Pseudomaricurvus alcaniphilus]